MLSLTPVSQVHPIINLPSSLKCSSTLCLQKVPPVVPCPSGTAAPSLDCPGARAILEHYVDLILSERIPNTLRALEQLFDESHEMLWVKVLDSLMSCEDEEQLNRLPVHCYPFKMHLQPCWIQTLGMVFVRQVRRYPSRMQKLKMPARMPCWRNSLMWTRRCCDWVCFLLSACIRSCIAIHCNSHYGSSAFWVGWVFSCITMWLVECKASIIHV